MSPFSRKLIRPSAEGLRQYVLTAIAKHIPISPAWFSASSLASDKELGKQIRAWGSVLSDVALAIAQQRYNVLLSSAEGENLDVVAQALGFKRKAGESDDSYAARVASELTVDRVTPVAVEAIIQRLDTEANSLVFEPWRDLKFRGTRSPRSGRPRRSDTRYWRGGVVDLIHDRYVAEYYNYVTKSLAAGVRGYYTLLMEGQQDAANDPLSATWPDTSEPLGFVTNSVEVVIDSVGSYTELEGKVLEQEPVALETNQSIEVAVDTTPQILVTAGLIFENLSRNYRLEADMFQSALTGVPVYTVAVEDPLNLFQHTNIQPAPIILNGLAELDDSWTLGGYGVFM